MRDRDSALERWARIETLFHEALARPAAERAAWLAAATGGDAALRDEVQSLLASHAAEGALGVRDDEPPPAVGQVGPYRLLRRLAEGGMGTVYVAERREADFTQVVALKLLRAGIADPRLEARLRAERRILARLEHPGIARLIDGGTTAAGQPYVVMEFVAGTTLHEHCDAHRLDVPGRLRLFLAVCEAVAYAHRQLVVHRDLKPGNILVTPDGRPKLLDFGIAKALDPEGSAPPSDGESHTVAWFTPAYASPEQIRGEPVDTAADVYALGVLLYELLAGRRPHDLTGLSPAEIERRVSGTDPERPSVAAAGPEAEARATARRTAPERLRRRLLGDLDTIALTALARDPSRRYPSVERLADDVRRYLDGLPVTARPDSIAYHAHKFVRRHRTAVAAAAVAVLSLVGGLAAAAWQATAAGRERDRAETALRRSEEVTGFLLELFEASDPTRAVGADTASAWAVLRRGLGRVDELRGQPAVQARLLDVLGQVLVNLGQYDSAGALFERGLTLRRAAGDEVTPEIAISFNNLARIRRAEARFAEAERLYLAALAIQRDHLDPDDPAIATTLSNLGFLMPYMGRLQETGDYYRQALALRRRAHGDDHPETLRAMASVAGAARLSADFAAAEQLMRATVDGWRRVLGPDDPETARSIVQLADLIVQARGPAPEAADLYRAARDILRRRLGDTHLGLVHPNGSLADWHLARGEGRPAEALERENLRINLRILGEANPAIPASLGAIANGLVLQGRFAEAETLYRRASAGWIATMGPRHWARAGTLRDYARTLDSLGRPAEAEARLREAIGLLREGLGESHANTAGGLTDLAEHLARHDRPAEAEGLYQDALRIAEQVYGPEHPGVAGHLASYARFLTLRGRASEAVPLLRRAVDIRRRRLDPRHPDIAAAAAQLDMALRAAAARPADPKP